MSGKIALVNDFRCETDYELTGDPLRLRQVLINLLSNAMKFTESGTVTVITSCTPAGKRELQLTIIVQDTGIGIAQEKLEAIFGEFYQADNSITRKYGGTGLGLSISRSLVELMGGRISAESAAGAGTRFTVSVTLPPRAGTSRRRQA